MKVVDAKKAIHDMADHSQKWHNGTSTRIRSTETSNGLAVIQAQLNNLGREIKNVNERVYAAQYHSLKEEDIEQLLRDSTKQIAEILRIKSEVNME
ncbi:hypothetical protein Tco_0769837 [Tanacetum coccineum]|uniref:Uncharacterized protein n=1 Tax=Tanacetum coccineum TaxID=301880 RepID=A0ABQ4ZBR3_9ASTR